MSPSASSGYTLDIGIVGGGIAGLCLALGLVNKGVKVTVYDSIRSYREIGAGIALGPNAIKALDLIDPRLTKGALQAGSHNNWSSYQGTVFSFRQGQDTEQWKTFDFVECAKHPLGLTAILRADFMDEAFKLLPNGIVQFSKRVVGLTYTPGGKTSLSFQDGSQAEHDLVVGCDGIHSIARKYVLGENKLDAWPNWSNKVYHRGVVDMDKAISIVGEEFAMNSTIYLGEHAHLVTLPLANATKVHVGGFVTRATWDRQEWVQKTTKEEMIADYAGWGEKLLELLGQLESTDIWYDTLVLARSILADADKETRAIFDLPHGKSFVKDNVALAGDAAHASTPFQGSGSSMAIEDAYVLSNLLASVTRVDQIPRALQAYDQVRRPRGQELVKTSQDSVKILEYEAPYFGKNLERIRADIRTRFNWIWDEDLEAELAQAMTMMGQLA